MQEAARWLDRHRTQRRLASWIIVGSMLLGLAGVGLGHDLLGWTELQSAIPLVAGVAASLGTSLWVLLGPLRGAVDRERTVARYRELARLGLVAPQPAGDDGDAAARLCARIAALAADAELVRAAEGARDRARMLEQELAHLDTGARGAEAARVLDGLRDRVAGEIARLHAQLAETYAALLELDGAGDTTVEALTEARERLRAELEVVTHGRRAAAAAHRAT